MARPSDSSASQSRPSGSHKPKVVYVMGQGKSGSTILGVALGNCTDVFFAGELSNWLASAGRPLLGGSQRTRFWDAVRTGVEGCEELFGTEAYQCLERGLSAFRVNRWLTRRRLRKQYRPVTESLYRSIANSAQVTHVVDTSHLPLRARELQNMEGLDLYLLFLVRDVESIVASHTRHIKRNDVARRRLQFFAVNARLWVTYLLAVIVFLRQPRDRRLLLQHEDFIANPERVLRQILDLSESSAEIPDLTSLRTGLPLNGNRLIRSEVVALKAEPAPPHRPSRLMRLTQRPWTMILGRLRPATDGASTHTGAPASHAT